MAKSPKFQIHYNRELGKKYYSERDYRNDMKSAGLEHFDPTSVKPKETKPYQQSEWAKGMLKDIVDRNGRRPGDRFVAELEKRGYTRERAEEARRLADGKR